MLLAAAEVNQPPVSLVSKQNVKLTDLYVKQAFSSKKHEAQDAITSNAQRFQKYIENRWVELNLIDQVKRGAVPDDMPALDQLMVLIDQTTLARLMIKKLAEDHGQPLNTAARDKYQKNLSDYKLPERVKAAHILIKADNRSDDEARELAKQVRDMALAEKDSFADLAKKYSEDSSVQRNNGDLGFFTRGKMAKPFEDAVFAMQKPGEISSVVKTQFGYHIIRFAQKQSGRVQPFTAVKETIKKQLSTQRQQEIWKQYQSKAANGNALVSKEQVNTWLWFAGMDNIDKSMPEWKQSATKLSMAKLLAEKAVDLKFDQDFMVKQKLKKAKREAMVKLRRKALFSEISKRDYSIAVKEQYLVNRDQYIAPLQSDISMVFLSKQKYTDAERIQLAESIYQQLESGKSSIETLALKYSDAAGVENNKGHIGLKQREAFGSTLGEAIFAEDKPGVIGPLAADDGIFIIKINQVQPRHQLSLDEVKESIKAVIVNDLASQEYNQLVQSILNNPENVVNDKAVERLYAELKQSR
jgi:peptidyl-prolyl cis-trans isomerase C